MAFIHGVELFIHVVRHLNLYLGQWAQLYGAWFYAIIFVILFCETGLVIFPLLPGDSLLFAVGAVSASLAQQIHIGLLILAMIAAALSGDVTNYWIGRRLGQWMIRHKKLIRPEHLKKTEDYFVRYGSKTIVIARFIPIVRTMAPFVAGLGRMKFPRFLTFSFLAAVFWIGGVTFLGFEFGNIPAVQKHFDYVIAAVIIVSLIPVLLQSRKLLARG